MRSTYYPGVCTNLGIITKYIRQFYSYKVHNIIQIALLPPKTSSMKRIRSDHNEERAALPPGLPGRRSASNPRHTSLSVPLSAPSLECR